VQCLLRDAAWFSLAQESAARDRRANQNKCHRNTRSSSPQKAPGRSCLVAEQLTYYLPTAHQPSAGPALPLTQSLDIHPQRALCSPALRPARVISSAASTNVSNAANRTFAAAVSASQGPQHRYRSLNCPLFVCGHRAGSQALLPARRLIGRKYRVASATASCSRTRQCQVCACCFTLHWRCDETGEPLTLSRTAAVSRALARTLLQQPLPQGRLTTAIARQPGPLVHHQPPDVAQSLPLDLRGRV
jgi:hypothetical protein